MFAIYSIPLQEEPESRRFPPDHVELAVPEMRITMRDISNFPTKFDVAGFTPACGARASQLASGFITKGIDLCIAVESVCPCEEEWYRPSSLLSCCYFPELLKRRCLV